MKNITLIFITLLALSGCEPNQDQSVISTNVLPQIPLIIDLKSFDLPVQQQFSQRLKYIDLIKKQNNDKSKYGWAVGQLGKTYHAYQKSDEARDCYLNAIANDPTHIEWYYLLGHVYKTTGDLEKAKQYFNKVLDIEDHTPTKIWLADVLLQQNKLEQALKLSNNVLLTDPIHPMALYNLALLKLQSNDNKLAIELLLKILTLQPNAYQVHYQLGQLYSKLGQSDLASSHLKKVPDDGHLRVSIQFRDPIMQTISDLRRGAQSLIKKAMKASAQGFNIQAVQLLHKAIETNPDRIDTSYNLAIVYLKMKNKIKAWQQLEKITVKDDKVYALMAKINKSEKQYEQAINNLLKALDLKSDNTSYLSLLGDIYSLKNNYLKSLYYYKISLKIDADQDLVQLKRARVLIQNHTDTTTIRQLLINHVFSPNFKITKQNFLCRLYIHTSIDKAEVCLSQINQIENSMTTETMAMIAANKGQFNQAITYQQKALKLAQDKTTINSNIDIKKLRLKNYQAKIPPKTVWHAYESLSIN